MVTANYRHAITYIVDEPFNQVQKEENTNACFVTIGFRVHMLQQHMANTQLEI